MEREPAFARVVQGTDSGYANAAAYDVALQCQSDPNLDARLDVLERENDRLKRDNEFLRETLRRDDPSGFMAYGQNKRRRTDDGVHPSTGYGSAEYMVCLAVL